jgi:ABC-type lipoprotein release transport system permease subunit
MDLRTIVLCTAAATFLACAAGIVPALRAYRTPVVQGLRPLG